MKRILGIVLAAAMMLTVSSCGGPAASSNGAASEGAAAPTGEAAEITFATWGNEEEMQVLVDLYNETQSEIHVTRQVTPLTWPGHSPIAHSLQAGMASSKTISSASWSIK